MFIKSPRNTVGQYRQDVTLHCQLEYSTERVNQTFYVEWREHITSRSGVTISRNSLLYQNLTSVKYGLSGDHPSGEYNLIIKDFTEEDVGWYSCGIRSFRNYQAASAFVTYYGKDTLAFTNIRRIFAQVSIS